MEKSDEISGLVTSLVETFGTPAMSSAFWNVLSTEPGTLVIGSDPQEWWDHPDQLRRVLTAQTDELRGLSAKVVHCEGWAEGTVGWAAAKAEMSLPDLPPVMMRITVTWARREGDWKIVQAHASLGVPNEEAVGKNLTT
jgi:SnoaL-like domain